MGDSDNPIDVFLIDYQKASSGLFKFHWIISPFEFQWPGANNIFKTCSNNGGIDEKLTPALLYRDSMIYNYRASIQVCVFLKYKESKKFAHIFENGLLCLYGLDYISCISQWMYIIEGYTRGLFNVAKASDISSWKQPSSGLPEYDKIVSVLFEVFKEYYKNYLFRTEDDLQHNDSKLSRHTLLHGKKVNYSYFSQANSLRLLYAIETLLAIEMYSNGDFLFFDYNEQQKKQIDKRVQLYSLAMGNTFSEESTLKLEIFNESYTE